MAVLKRAMPERIYNPIRQWGFRQCLPFSWTTLRGKNCRHPIAVMGVVDTFGPGSFSQCQAFKKVICNTFHSLHTLLN